MRVSWVGAHFMSEHTPPSAFPKYSFVGGAVPRNFSDVIVAAAAKNKTLYWDQMLAWAQMGAECSRLHEPKTTRSRRK